MSKLKLIGLGLAAALLFTAGWGARGWRADKDLAEMMSAMERRASEALAAESKANALALADRETELEKMAAESAALADKLKETFENDPETRSWGATILPGSVIGLLQ